MLLSGERLEMEQQLAPVLAGYTEFMDFNPAELRLIEPLRTLRMLHYNAWLAKRWDDPAFRARFRGSPDGVTGRNRFCRCASRRRCSTSRRLRGNHVTARKIIRYGVPEFV